MNYIYNDFYVQKLIILVIILICKHNISVIIVGDPITSQRSNYPQVNEILEPVTDIDQYRQLIKNNIATGKVNFVVSNKMEEPSKIKLHGPLLMINKLQSNLPANRNDVPQSDGIKLDVRFNASERFLIPHVTENDTAQSQELPTTQLLNTSLPKTEVQTFSKQETRDIANHLVLREQLHPLINNLVRIIQPLMKNGGKRLPLLLIKRRESLNFTGMYLFDIFQLFLCLYAR